MFVCLHCMRLLYCYGTGYCYVMCILVLILCLPLQKILPEGQPITVCDLNAVEGGFQPTVHLPLTTREEAFSWLQNFQDSPPTTLRSAKTYPHVGSKVLFKVGDKIFSYDLC